MDNPNTGKVWLEPLLTEHLGRVAAPQELWDRIQAPRPLAVRSSGRQIFVWAVAAAALLVVTAAAVWQFRLRPEAVAALALRRGADSSSSDRRKPVQFGRGSRSVPVSIFPCWPIRRRRFAWSARALPMGTNSHR